MSDGDDDVGAHRQHNASNSNNNNNPGVDIGRTKEGGGSRRGKERDDDDDDGRFLAVVTPSVPAKRKQASVEWEDDHHKSFKSQAKSPPTPNTNNNATPTTTITPASANTSVHTVDNNTIRCICGSSMDDGLSIACDICERWCHAACFDIVLGFIPEEWKCWECSPRPVDREKAARIQREKLPAILEAQRVLAEGGGGGAGAGSGNGGSSGSGVLGKEDKGRSEKKQRRAASGAESSSASSKRRRRLSAAAQPPTAASISSSMPPSISGKAASATPAPGSGNEDDILEIEDAWTQSYVHIEDDIVTNEEIRQRLHRQAQEWRGITAFIPSPTPPTTTSIRIVDPNSAVHPALSPSSSLSSRPPIYAVHTTAPVPADAFVARYSSVVGPSGVYVGDALNGYAGMGHPKPFVHLVGAPWHVALDARMAGSEGRFVRSGCKPNAVLRPVLCAERRGGGGEGDAAVGEGGEEALKFAIFATRELKEGEEVVLGWEWDDGNVVHALPAMIQDPHLFSFSPPASARSGDCTLPASRREEVRHVKKQVANILHGLGSTFATCACGGRARDCAFTVMADFVNADEDVYPSTSSGLGSANSTSTSSPVVPYSLRRKTDLVALLGGGRKRGFSAREVVPSSGGMGGVEEVVVVVDDDDDDVPIVRVEPASPRMGGGSLKGKERAVEGEGREGGGGRAEKTRSVNGGKHVSFVDETYRTSQSPVPAFDHRDLRPPDPPPNSDAMDVDPHFNHPNSSTAQVLVNGEMVDEDATEDEADDIVVVHGPRAPPPEEFMPPKMRKRWMRRTLDALRVNGVSSSSSGVGVDGGVVGESLGTVDGKENVGIGEKGGDGDDDAMHVVVEEGVVGSATMEKGITTAATTSAIPSTVTKIMAVASSSVSPDLSMKLSPTTSTATSTVKSRNAHPSPQSTEKKAMRKSTLEVPEAPSPSPATSFARLTLGVSSLSGEASVGKGAETMSRAEDDEGAGGRKDREMSFDLQYPVDEGRGGGVGEGVSPSSSTHATSPGFTRKPSAVATTTPNAIAIAAIPAQPSNSTNPTSKSTQSQFLNIVLGSSSGGGDVDSVASTPQLGGGTPLPVVDVPIPTSSNASASASRSESEAASTPPRERREGGEDGDVVMGSSVHHAEEEGEGEDVRAQRDRGRLEILRGAPSQTSSLMSSQSPPHHDDHDGRQEDKRPAKVKLSLKDFAMRKRRQREEEEKAHMVVEGGGEVVKGRVKGEVESERGVMNGSGVRRNSGATMSTPLTTTATSPTISTRTTAATPTTTIATPTPREIKREIVKDAMEVDGGPSGDDGEIPGLMVSPPRRSSVVSPSSRRASVASPILRAAPPPVSPAPRPPTVPPTPARHHSLSISSLVSPDHPSPPTSTYIWHLAPTPIQRTLTVEDDAVSLGESDDEQHHHQQHRAERNPTPSSSPAASQPLVWTPPKPTPPVLAPLSSSTSNNNNVIVIPDRPRNAYPRPPPLHHGQSLPSLRGNLPSTMMGRKPMIPPAHTNPFPGGPGGRRNPTLPARPAVTVHPPIPTGPSSGTGGFGLAVSMAATRGGGFGGSASTSVGGRRDVGPSGSGKPIPSGPAALRQQEYGHGGGSGSGGGGGYTRDRSTATPTPPPPQPHTSASSHSTSTSTSAPTYRDRNSFVGQVGKVPPTAPRVRGPTKPWHPSQSPIDVDAIASPTTTTATPAGSIATHTTTHPYAARPIEPPPPRPYFYEDGDARRLSRPPPRYIGPHSNVSANGSGKKPMMVNPYGPSPHVGNTSVGPRVLDSTTRGGMLGGGGAVPMPPREPRAHRRASYIAEQKKAQGQYQGQGHGLGGGG